MEESPKDLEKNDDESDEDNKIGVDYFLMDRKDNSSELNSNEDEESNTIPNVRNYLNGNDNEVKEIIENPKINNNLSLIENNIEENINMKHKDMSQNKSLINVNNVNVNNIINNINFNNESNNKNNDEEEISLSNEDNMNTTQKNNINNNEKENSNSRNSQNPIVLSDDEEDLKEINGEEFKRHFQEDRYGPERKIGIIEPDENKNIIRQNNFKDIRRKNKVDESKLFDNFFQEKEPKINKNKIIQKKYNNNNMIYNKNKNRNFNHQNNKEFIPMIQNDFKTNTYFEKLLINRVEHQILTNIYNSYEDKSKFETTYSHIRKLKHLITNSGVEEAMKYLDNIEPLELRAKIAIESTYFFKEVVKEEVENAKAHDGKLILIKQPDFLYRKNLSNFSGKINQFRGSSNNRIRNNNIRYDNYNHNMNNQQRNVYNNINRNNNREFNINNPYNKNSGMLQGNKMNSNYIEL